ncbi:MAG: glycosyltransferase family 4 protein [Alphaproteobacteria bacterium]|nr:glycosyltransferase family 4 protein [Alphaproteobacteria bacterium]
MKPVTQKPKILYVITEDWYFCSHRLNLARAAQAQGFTVHLATNVHHHEDKIRSLGFNLHPLFQLKRSSLSPWREIKAIFELWRIYRKIKPDIVHHVALKPVLYGTLIARILRIKIIINALGGLGSLLISETPKMRRLQKVIFFLLKHLLNNKTQRLIVQNQADYTLWQSKAKLPATYLVLIPGSGVDIDHFKPRQHKPNPLPLIICATRMLWDKGIGELASAARILKQKQLKFQLLLCGSIDDQNPSAIDKSELIKWQKEELLEWIGHVEDIAPIYQTADIAVLPSYREGLPKTLLEAAACSLPIITTDVPGCRDIVHHQVNGLLVPAQNPHALSNALELLIKNQALRQLYGKAGRIRVEKEFADSLIINYTLALYN